MTLVTAFLCGFFSDLFGVQILKIIFAVFIAIVSILMLRPVKEGLRQNSKFRVKLKSGEITYHINLFLFVPIVLLTGFVSGMVGVSGGSFLVPLMVLVVGGPMHIAVGTSTTLVMITATAGFLGHLSTGHFDASLAIPLAIAGAAGGYLGTHLTVKIPSKKLKLIFAGTSLLAALLMVLNT